MRVYQLRHTVAIPFALGFFCVVTPLRSKWCLFAFNCKNGVMVVFLASAAGDGACDDDGRGAGVRHPADHHGKAALRPSQLPPLTALSSTWEHGLHVQIVVIRTVVVCLVTSLLQFDTLINFWNLRNSKSILRPV